jgi:hypothetical protein
MLTLWVEVCGFLHSHMECWYSSSVDDCCLLDILRSSIHCSSCYFTLPGDSWVMDITVADEYIGLCDQKSLCMCSVLNGYRVMTA